MKRSTLYVTSQPVGKSNNIVRKLRSCQLRFPLRQYKVRVTELSERSNSTRLTVVHSYSKKMLESGDNQIKNKKKHHSDLHASECTHAKYATDG